MSAPAGARLRLDYPADHVARLTIDNQAKRNALDRELLRRARARRAARGLLGLGGLPRGRAFAEKRPPEFRGR